MTADDISKHLKFAVALLCYPTQEGIAIERVDAHSLRGGGANTLGLSGNTDTQIQKMRPRRGATSKEYLCEGLAKYSTMKARFNFMNITGNTFIEIADTVITMECNTAFVAAAAS